MVCGYRKHHSTCYQFVCVCVCVCKSLYHSDPEQQTFVYYCNVNYYLPDKRERKSFRELGVFRDTTSLVAS